MRRLSLGLGLVCAALFSGASCGLLSSPPGVSSPPEASGPSSVSPEPAATTAPPPHDPAPGADWTELVPGLHYRLAPAAAGRAELALVRVDPAQVRIEVVDVRSGGQKAATARQVAEQTRALAVINGGFFDERGEPLGLLMHRGERTNPLRRADWGIFLLRPQGPQIRHTREGVPSRTQEALQCGPRLVIAGRIPEFKPGLAPRSAVGITAEGQVMLAATARGPLSLEELARALKHYGCRDALNLDGGSSRQLYLRAGAVELDLPALIPVPSLLAVLPGVERRTGARPGVE